MCYLILNREVAQANGVQRFGVFIHICYVRKTFLSFLFFNNNIYHRVRHASFTSWERPFASDIEERIVCVELEKERTVSTGSKSSEQTAHWLPQSRRGIQKFTYLVTSLCYI